MIFWKELACRLKKYYSYSKDSNLMETRPPKSGMPNTWPELESSCPQLRVFMKMIERMAPGIKDGVYLDNFCF